MNAQLWIMFVIYSTQPLKLNAAAAQHIPSNFYFEGELPVLPALDFFVQFFYIEQSWMMEQAEAFMRWV